jgi:hypothetical protein
VSMGSERMHTLTNQAAQGLTVLDGEHSVILTSHR